MCNITWKPQNYGKEDITKQKQKEKKKSKKYF